MNNIQMVENIKKLCAQKNMTISQLEKMLNLSNGLISRWKKTTPSLDIIIDIARFFNVTIDSIIGEKINTESDYTIHKLINLLYQETHHLKIEWNVLDINNPPIKFTKIIYDILNHEESDYYYVTHEKGCFILGRKYTNSINELILLALPDSNSTPLLICDDYNQLIKLFELVSNNLQSKLNELKVGNFINSFLETYNASEVDLDEANIHDSTVKFIQYL